MLEKITPGTACEACGQRFATERHHIRTKGAGGSDHRFNILWLCTCCHSFFHTLGRDGFIRMFPSTAEKIKTALDHPRQTTKTTRSKGDFFE